MISFFAAFAFVSSSSTFTKLLPTDLYTNTLSEGEYSFYYAYLSVLESADFALQPFYGDSNLFLNITCESNTLFQLPYPSKSHSQFFSESPIILDTIHLSVSNLSLCSETTIAKVSVLCLSDQCGFALYFDQGQHMFLVDQKPLQGRCEANDFTYFRYYRHSTNPFQLILTVIGNSNPDLYVAFGGIPTKDNATWVGNTVGGETLVIPEGDEGVYYIGVTAYMRSEFSLLVLTSFEAFIPLYSGMPQNIYNSGAKRNLFVYWSKSNEDIEIKATVKSGNIKLLANPQNPLNEEQFDKIPTHTKHTWASFNRNNEQFSIIIRKNDPMFCIECNIIISVISRNQSEYLITVVNSQYLEVITNGVPVQGVVMENKLNSYLFTLDSSSDLEFRLSVYSGDADFYVDTTTPVSKSFHKWSSNKAYSEEILSIPRTDKNWGIGTYYIAVEGWRTSSYSLIIFAKSSLVQIIPGYSHVYSLAHPMSFLLTLSSYRAYFCTVTSLIDNLKPLIYINTNYSTQNPIPASPSTSDIRFEDSSSYSYSNTFSFNLSSNLTKTVSISIFAVTEYREPYITFLCASDNSVVKLSQNDYSYQTLFSGTMMFEVMVVAAESLTFNVFTCNGSLSLEVSKEPEKFVKDPDVVVMNDRGRSVGKVFRASGRYYIKVLGVEGSIFEIFTDTGSSFKMVPGGEITYKAHSKGFTVTWPKVIIEPGSADFSVVYYVYISNEVYKELYTQCGLKILEDSNLVSVVGPFRENYAEVALKSDLFVNVVAVFGRHTFETQGNAVYDAIYLKWVVEKKKTDTSFSWIYIVFVIAIIIIAAIVYRYRKLRPQRRSEGYELYNYN